MRKTKKYLVVAVGLWMVSEVGYQTYVSNTYRLRDRFNWSYYAFHRNRPAIDRLYVLASRARTQRATVEIRRGQVIDSAGPLPGAARALLVELAHDIEPAGTFYFAVDPVRPWRHSLTLTVACSVPSADQPGCYCTGWLPPADGGGVLFRLESNGPARGPGRGHTRTEFEYVRVSNPSLHEALRQSPCYARARDGEFLTTKALPSSFPIAYNGASTDLLVTKALRATGLL